MNIHIENYQYFLWILVLPIVIFLWRKFSHWREKKRLIFAEKRFQPFLFSEWDKGRIFVRLYFLAFSFLLMAILGFISQEKTEIPTTQKTSNILFLIDVSNSMNAQDVEPSRLGRTQEILTQIFPHLQEERVGIVVFAGEAQSIMPLTTDYSSAQLYTQNLNSQMIKKQGTDFSLAVKTAIERLNFAQSGTKNIILISDGEDNESNHDDAIQEAKKQGVSITSVGIGTEEGAPIPELFLIYSDYKKDENGQTIITKRETQALKSIADETGGVYIDGNQSDAVQKIIAEIKNTAQETQEKTTRITQKTHYYQWFLGIAIILFLIIFWFNPKRDLEF